MSNQSNQGIDSQIILTIDEGHLAIEWLGQMADELEDVIGRISEGRDILRTELERIEQLTANIASQIDSVAVI